MPHKEERKLCNAYKEYIDSLCVKYNVKKLLAGTVPLVEALQPEKKELINPLMKFGYCPAATTPTYTWICNLNGAESELVKKCEQTTRQALRKLEAENRYKIIEASNNKSDYEKYVELHIKTYTRTGATKQIIHEEYQKNIFEKLIPQKICRVFFLKDKDKNEIVASVAIIIHKNSAYYWWGASIDEKEVGINKYLLWKSMNIIKDEYYKNGGDGDFWFETGGAYIYARNHYTMIREMPTGKGFADIVLIPYRNNPAMIIELKWNQEVKTAIDQIKEKKYPKGLEKYKDNLLIVGISYDKKTKKHTCHIEEMKAR